MNKYLRLGAAVLAVSSLSACATVTRGTKQKFEISSVPPGADVELSTGVKCVTPCKLKLKRKTEFTARLTKEGYEPAEVAVQSKIRGGGVAGAAGNLLIGGIIGGIVDGTNGSMNDLTPNPLKVTLTPTAGGAATEAASPQ